MVIIVHIILSATCITKKAKCELVTQKLAQCLPVVRIAESQDHLPEPQPTRSSRPHRLMRATSAPCLRVNGEATRLRTHRTKSTVFDSTRGKNTNLRTHNRCKRFLPFYRTSYESSSGFQFLTSNYMATTFTCPSKSNPSQCPLPCCHCANSCGQCGKSCGCYCLPPPCNTIPKCSQYKRDYHCPCGFSSRGSYHVMGCCYPCSPYCGPRAPCLSNPGTPCSLKCPYAYYVPSMNYGTANMRIVSKVTPRKLVRSAINKSDAKPLSSLIPGSKDSSITSTTRLSKLIFCTSVGNSIKVKSQSVTTGSKPRSDSDVTTKPKYDNRTIEEGVRDDFELDNLCTTGIFEKYPAAFMSPCSEPSDTTQLIKCNTDPSMLHLLSTCALYNPFIALCTGDICPPLPPQSPKESSPASGPGKGKASNSSPSACGCCCSCGPCGCGPCGCGPCGCGPCGCGCSPCGSCAGPCPTCLGFNCGPNCGPQGCNCPCGGCAPCGCGPCGCGPCGCGPCGCGPCGCGPCCGSCAPCGCGSCGPCGCGPCFPPCLPCPINPGSQSSGPLAAGANLRFPTKCCGIFTTDFNLGGCRVQDPMGCHKDSNNSNSICFCEVCRANRTQANVVSQHKVDEDCHSNLNSKTTPSSKTTKRTSKLAIDPKLAKEYPFSKVPPEHKEHLC